MATGNPNFDAIISTTLKKYVPRIEDNIFKNLPLLYFLQEADHIDKIDGGEQLVEPLMYAQNSTAGSYAGYDNIDTTPQEGVTSAVYDWRQYAATVAIAGIEEAKNSGDAAVVRLLDAKIQQAEMSIQETMESMLFADGTGNSAKDWYGLAYYVATTPTTGTVGGIDRSDANNSWWRNYVESTSTALTIPIMSTAYNTVSKGKDHPDFILTTQALFEKYESLLQPQLRFADPTTADAGFQNLLYKSAPIMYADYAQSGVMYFLNSKYLRLKVHSDVWFKPTPFEKPHGQDAKYSQILSYGNLTASNCKRLGKLTAKT